MDRDSSSPVDSAQPQLHCLATVTSGAFVLGTQVMLHSFRKHNPWFRGDVVVFHAGDSERVHAALAEVAGVRLVTASDALRTRLDVLVDAVPALRDRRARFLSLETFRLEGYEKVLFCDSDLLFCGSVEPLFARAESLIASGDGAFLRGYVRDPVTFAEIPRSDGMAPACLDRTFNAGLLVIGKELLGSRKWQELMAALSAERWLGLATDHSDQFVLNTVFAGRAAIVDPVYNYQLLHSPEPAQGRFEDAVVLHFNGPAKPWMLRFHAEAAHRNPRLIEALRLWYASYLDWLAANSLRTVADDRTGIPAT